jgi:beta-glucosidase
VRGRSYLSLVPALVALVALPSAAEAAGPAPLPGKFHWGVASSAFQSEGTSPRTNWNVYIDQDPDKAPYGKAVDFFHRYRSDIRKAAGLGVDTYRISINWARVEPRPGRFSKRGLRFYDRVFDAMRTHGIRPVVTLNHWDYPIWVYRQGGWTNSRTIDDFLALTRKIVHRYRRPVRDWITFNEQFFYQYLESGNYPLDAGGTAAMQANMITAHRRAYGLIHRIDRTARVTSNYAWSGVGPLTDSNADPFLDAVADRLDYVGLDYYYPAYDQISTLIELANNTSWEAQLDPFGMYTALRSMHRSYPGLPIVITENGMPTENGGSRADGWTREDDLRDTLYWVQRARSDGVPVQGYYYWSLTDNYEWGSYVPRFGLYSVDAVGDPRLKRVPTAAVDVYRRSIRRGGVPRGYELTRPTDPSDCMTASVDPADRDVCLAAST